jgi:hypothetical protein
VVVNRAETLAINPQLQLGTRKVEIALGSKYIAIPPSCRETLLSANGKNARAHREGRGLDCVAQEELGLYRL